MQRAFLQPDDVRDLVADQFGAARRPIALDRLTGGSRKGVYRLRLDDQTKVILYVWAAVENYWPPWSVDRALSHLHTAATRDARLADAHDRIAGHVRRLRGAVTARETYGLVHGELGPDHVLVTPAGEPVMIDFEGLTYFDVEWDHAWLQMRFGDAYPLLRPVDLDPHRLELYRYAQVLSLIEGPLRIADTDFPGRQWMLDLAEWNIGKALAVP
ncbi:hypothetical protein E1193_29480 [Micromonospora sp. KC606]|uniref:phosphotransferase n=1 Tax=Micromonospora sp. KC606 TaxID=2530379 RepID=UPI001045C94B|nr:phosphotransferase [Micromonospora sp. KC606]TDC70860.1 hypothetical protein E1193_29480 [Micromonospora sp. KC606]